MISLCISAWAFILSALLDTTHTELSNLYTWKKTQ